MSDIFDIALVNETTSGSMSLWSDEKRKDYVKLFKERSGRSYRLYWLTAWEILNETYRKGYLSYAQNQKAYEELNRENRTHGYANAEDTALAKDRAKEILQKLPSLNKVMAILDPDTSKLMDERDEVLAKGQELADKLQEYPEEIKLSEVEQDMTIGQFRAYVKKLDSEKKQLVEEMDELGKRGQDLEKQIGKALLKGIPGLSQEILDVITELVNKAKALQVITNRVEEQVLYGDCENAMEMLRHFHKDEAKIEGEIKEKFLNSLEKLQLLHVKKKAPKKGKKELTE